MNLKMTYIDYNSATVEERETFSFTEEQIEPILQKIKEDKDVLGAVLIATCNRTELYLSLKDDTCTDPVDILIGSASGAGEEHRHLFRCFEGDDAIRHLSRLASGAESQLWGDTQIISQVREAIKAARKCGASDSILNVVFRNAISAGKKIRSQVDLHIHDDSTVDRAIQRVMSHGGIKSVLVIGNGTIGRAVASGLAIRGMDCKMTLRQYHHGESIVPYGVEAVKYDERYEVMEGCDAVVSATASPHCVLKYDEMIKLKNRPCLIVDMAVPRDCEPEIDYIEGIALEDIDDISRGHDQAMREEQTRAVDRYIDKYIEDFHHWHEFRGYVNSDRRFFPMFMDSEGAEVLVVGGGTIAERRVLTLLNFCFEITVISPEATSLIEEHASNGQINWIREKFDPEMELEGYDMILAATDDRDVNKLVGILAKKAGIPVSVCDDRTESSMWFPAIAMNDELTVGIIGTGKEHGLVKKAASGIRKVVEGKEYR